MSTSDQVLKMVLNPLRPGVRSGSPYEPGERSINEIISDLSRPLPERHRIRVTEEGGIEPSEAARLLRRLLDYFAPGWTCHVLRLKESATHVTVVVRLTVPSTTGDVTRESLARCSLYVERTSPADRIADDAAYRAERLAFIRAGFQFGYQPGMEQSSVKPGKVAA